MVTRTGTETDVDSTYEYVPKYSTYYTAAYSLLIKIWGKHLVLSGWSTVVQVSVQAAIDNMIFQGNTCSSGLI